jgi:hypothetical protein
MPGSLAGIYQNQMTATGSLTGGTSPFVSVATTSLGGDAGNVVDTTDPDDLDTRTYSDPLGRTVQTIQDFTNGAVTDDSNKRTDYTYNSVSKTSLTAELTSGVGETTTWLYGVTTGTGSTIDSNDIVSTTEQPNPTTGLPDSSIETTVDVDELGDTLNSTDPDGTTHAYSQPTRPMCGRNNDLHIVSVISPALLKKVDSAKRTQIRRGNRRFNEERILYFTHSRVTPCSRLEVVGQEGFPTSLFIQVRRAQESGANQTQSLPVHGQVLQSSNRDPSEWTVRFLDPATPLLVGLGRRDVWSSLVFAELPAC